MLYIYTSIIINVNRKGADQAPVILAYQNLS